MTLTYNPNLDKLKVKSHTTNQGHRSNGSAMRVLTHRQKDRSDSMTSTADVGGNDSHLCSGLWPAVGDVMCPAGIGLWPSGPVGDVGDMGEVLPHTGN